MMLILFACMVICPFTFLYFSDRAMYQAVRQAKQDAGGGKTGGYRPTVSLFLAGPSLLLLIVSFYGMFVW